MSEFLVRGVLVTPEIIALTMFDARMVCAYWIDSIQITRQPSTDLPLQGLGDPRLYAGDFQITVWADDSVNTVERADMQRSLEWLKDSNAWAFNRMVNGTQMPSDVDQFFQHCVFDAIIYEV